MEYTFSQVAEIKSKIFAKIQKEIEMANRNNEMDLILNKYGVTLEEERMPINTRTYRILVVGTLSGNKNDYYTASKKVGIDPAHLEFLDYEEFKRYDAAKLEYSTDFSDIIFGPVPHKTTGMGDTSSFLALAEANPIRYPRVIRCEANSTEKQLKFSISSFKDCLRRTFYFETLLEE